MSADIKEQSLEQEAEMMAWKRKDRPMTTEERLEKLEMELARAKYRNRLLLAVVLLGVVLLAVGATTPGVASREDIVRANGFALVDESGKVRAVLGVDKDGPRLVLSDENDTARVTLGVGKKGPVLGLSDKNGKTRAALGEAGLGLALVLSDENGMPCASLGVGKDGPALTLDENGNHRAWLGVVKDRPPTLFLFDKNGKVVWQAPP